MKPSRCSACATRSVRLVRRKNRPIGTWSHIEAAERGDRHPRRAPRCRADRIAETWASYDGVDRNVLIVLISACNARSRQFGERRRSEQVLHAAWNCWIPISPFRASSRDPVRLIGLVGHRTSTRPYRTGDCTPWALLTGGIAVMRVTALRSGPNRPRRLVVCDSGLAAGQQLRDGVASGPDDYYLDRDEAPGTLVGPRPPCTRAGRGDAPRADRDAARGMPPRACTLECSCHQHRAAHPSTCGSNSYA